MSSSFGYLIPKNNFPIGLFKKLMVTALESGKITDGYYNDDYQWLAAGSKSHSIFQQERIDDNPAFEYVEIHDTENNRIIPDCTSENFDSQCVYCMAPLDEPLNTQLMDCSDRESESGIEFDMAALTVKCSECDQLNKITDIHFGPPVKFKNQFACFVEIVSEFDQQNIKEIANKLGCSFDFIYGSF